MGLISKRIKQIIDFKKLSVLKFEKNIDVGNNSIGTAIRRNSNLSGNILSKILITYPDINPGWLLTGRGEMLLENKAENISGEPPAAYKKEKEPPPVFLLKNEIKRLEEKVKDKEKIISLQEDKIEKDAIEIKELKEKITHLKGLVEKKNDYHKPMGANTSLSSKPSANKPSIAPAVEKNIKKQRRTRE